MDRLSFRVMAQEFGVGLFLVALVFMGSKTAYADPHAVFYTATGQQQLFFNVLAGLNQADYVEPAQPQTGTPAGQSRQDLNQKQQTAAQQPKATINDVVNAGQTQLSSILTRNITLQGNDVWSSYQAFQLALEAARRRNSAELIQILCQHSFGLKNCQANAEDPKTAQARQQEAIESNPEDATLRSEQAVDAALFSGTPTDQAERQDLIDNNDDANKFRPYNNSVASAYDNTGNNTADQEYFDNLAQGAANTSSGIIDPDLFKNLSFDSDGQISDINTEDTTGTVNLLSAMLNAPAQFFSARVLAEEQQTQQDSVVDVNGVKADTYAVPHAGADGSIGEISQKISLPATAKIAEQNTAITTLEGVDSTRYYTSTDNSTLPAAAGQVLGTSTDSPDDNQAPADTTGQVLGTSTDSPTGSQPEPTDTLPPEPTPPADSTELDFNHETDIENFLDFLIGANSSGGCGNACSTENVLNNYSSQVLGN